MMRPIPLAPVSPSLAHSPGVGFTCKPPWEWSRHEVTEWLLQCEREYSLDKIDLKRFAMNGKALYILTKQDFMDRVPSIGDVLYNYIHMVSEESRRHLLYAPSPPQRSKLYDEMAFPYSHTQLPSPNHTQLSQPLYAKMQSPSPTSPGHAVVHHCESSHPPGSPTIHHTFGTMLSHGMLESHQEEGPENLVMYERREEARYLDIPMTPSPTSSSSDTLTLCDQHDGDERLSDHNNQEVPRSPSADAGQGVKKNKSEGRLLWDFLSNLLKCETAPNVISWEDEENDVFRIHDAGGLAVLWGRQKNRSNMTYEKMSRALRYYYKMNIIQKVKGKRLTYKFMKKPEEIRRNRGLALRFRAQQRRETSLQNAASSSPSIPPLLEASEQHEHEIKMDTSCSHDSTPTNGVISYAHMNETKPSIGQSLELNSQCIAVVSECSPVSPSSGGKFGSVVDHLGFCDQKR